MRSPLANWLLLNVDELLEPREPLCAHRRCRPPGLICRCCCCCCCCRGLSPDSASKRGAPLSCGPLVKFGLSKWSSGSRASIESPRLAVSLWRERFGWPLLLAARRRRESRSGRRLHEPPPPPPPAASFASSASSWPPSSSPAALAHNESPALTWRRNMTAGPNWLNLAFGGSRACRCCCCSLPPLVAAAAPVRCSSCSGCAAAPSEVCAVARPPPPPPVCCGDLVGSALVCIGCSASLGARPAPVALA